MSDTHIAKCSHCGQEMHATDAIERLRAENEALRKDASRYRWLRQAADAGIRNDPFWAICPPAPSAAIRSALELDTAIDAALEGTK